MGAPPGSRARRPPGALHRGGGRSGCYGGDYAYFESAHGTAPDLVGRHVINPTATLPSAAMMLDHLGFTAAARKLESGIDLVYSEGRSLPPDQGGSAATQAFCDAVEAAMARTCAARAWILERVYRTTSNTNSVQGIEPTHR